MASGDEDGGPAFPAYTDHRVTGLTIRDWFAGQALAGGLVRSDLVSFATFAAMIGLGVLCNSSAMQWMGAVLFFLVILTKAKNSLRKMTPAEIRADLDRIEMAEQSS